MLEKYDPETAKKVCGKLKAKYEKDFDHDLIIEKYNKLKLEHPEFDERELLEAVFSNISKDFVEDTKKSFKPKISEITNKIQKYNNELFNKIIPTIYSKQEKLENKREAGKRIIEHYISGTGYDRIPGELPTSIRQLQEKHPEAYTVFEKYKKWYIEKWLLEHSLSINKYIPKHLVKEAGFLTEEGKLDRDILWSHIQFPKGIEKVKDKLRLELWDKQSPNFLPETFFTYHREFTYSIKKTFRELVKKYNIVVDLRNKFIKNLERREKEIESLSKNKKELENKINDLTDELNKIKNKEMDLEVNKLNLHKKIKEIDNTKQDIEYITQQIKEYPKETEWKGLSEVSEYEYKNEKRENILLALGTKLEEMKIKLHSLKKEKKKLQEKIGSIITKSKGRGWWGESERHSKARKIGKADLQEDYPVEGYLTKKGKVVKTHERGSNIIKNEEVLKKIRKQRESDERHKKSSEKRQKEKIKLKVKRIVVKEEYHATCDECNRQLKKAIETDKGIFGYRCYLKLIGIPSRRQGLSVKDLPGQAFEGIAENFIEEFKKLNKREVATIILPYNTDIDKLQYGIRWRSDIHLRYYVDNYKRTGQGKWLEGSMAHQEFLRVGRQLEIPSEIMKRVYQSDALQQYWSSQVKKASENPLGTLIEDFSFPEGMSKSVGEGKIVKGEKKKVGICDDCKKEKELYYQKLCDECYQKRVKHYIEVYDFTLDYPVGEHTREGGKVKVQAHTRESGLEKYEREQKEEKLKKKFETHNIKNEKLINNYDDYLKSILDLLQHEKATPKEIAEVLDDLNIKEVHNVLKIHFGMPYNEHIKRMKFGRKHGFTPNKKRWLEGHRTEDDFQEDILIKKPLFIFDNIGDIFQIAGDMFDSVNLSEDAEAKPITQVGSNIPSGQTRIQQLWEHQKAFERAKRLGKEMGVETLVSPVKSITVPFSITNTESGKTMSGEVVENLENNTRQLMPVSSSTVRASGQFGSELLVQFHPSKLQPMRTYRYMFESAEQAGEANKSLILSGSPGRWIWQNLRGHIAGEIVSSTKLGPSLSPPGQGLPTIGGTSSSLVPYKISNRVPVSRVKNFDEILREMKRSASNPATNPMVGSRIEALMGTRKGLREKQTPGWRSGTKGLPPIGDFVHIGNVNDLEEDYRVRAHWRHYKSGKKSWIEAHERGDPNKYVVWIGGKRKVVEKKKTLLWKRIKNLRKELQNIDNQMSELGSNLKMGIDKKREIHEKLFEKFTKLNREIKTQIPKRKEHETDIKYLEASLERSTYEEERKEHKKAIEYLEAKIKKADEFDKELFEDKTIDYYFDKPLHKKLKIANGFITPINSFVVGDKINTINNTFYELPKNLQDSCRQIRIFEEATDDPTFGSLKSCGGFYNTVEETITIGLKNDRKDIFGFSHKFVKEATVHEAAHALDFTTLTDQERYDTMSFFSMNYERLNNRKEYAATNKLEFFAEGYTKLYTSDHHWFMGLKKGTKGFFQDIMKKYDFILDFLMKDLSNEINGIKFSYQDGNNHIFGFYQIPKDISQDESQKMVDEGKAQFENVDKYIEKEVLKKE